VKIFHGERWGIEKYKTRKKEEELTAAHAGKIPRDRNYFLCKTPLKEEGEGNLRVPTGNCQDAERKFNQTMMEMGDGGGTRRTNNPLEPEWNWRKRGLLICVSSGYKKEKREKNHSAEKSRGLEYRGRNGQGRGKTFTTPTIK